MSKIGNYAFYGTLVVCLGIVVNTLEIYKMSPEERAVYKDELANGKVEPTAEKQVASKASILSETQVVSHCDLTAKSRLNVPSSFDPDWTWAAGVAGDKWVVRRNFWAKTAYSIKVRMNYLCHVKTDGSGGGLEVITGEAILG